MAFQHIIVPLDGSQLAEAALPAAVRLAEVFQAQVTLLHVVESQPPKEVHGQPHLANREQASTYLMKVAEAHFPSGVVVQEHVHNHGVSQVTDSVVQHLQELGGDLIVMCTHGRGEVNLRLFGSLPQRVLALGTAPVLLIQPPEGGAPAQFDCQRILAPLDGDPEHERGLTLAAEMAQACQASLLLVGVVHTLGTLPGERAATGTLLPGATSRLLEINQQQVEVYLEQKKESLKSGRLAASSRVLRGDPASEIIHTIQAENIDLVVMGTHGKSGMQAFWSNSLPPKIAGKTRVPLLLVPVEGQGEDI
jgi:nucleotide-binding universal stress UspA family protein